jgi:hypothetical protein
MQRGDYERTGKEGGQAASSQTQSIVRGLPDKKAALIGHEAETHASIQNMPPTT